MSTDDTSERETKVFQFTFQGLLIHIQKNRSCRHLYEAHLGLDAAHSAVQEQHSCTHKYWKR